MSNNLFLITSIIKYATFKISQFSPCFIQCIYFAKARSHKLIISGIVQHNCPHVARRAVCCELRTREINRRTDIFSVWNFKEMLRPTFSKTKFKVFLIWCEACVVASKYILIHTLPLCFRNIGYFFWYVVLRHLRFDFLCCAILDMGGRNCGRYESKESTRKRLGGQENIIFFNIRHRKMY